MTAKIVDLAARRAERDAALRQGTEAASYGVALWPAGEGYEFYAELTSGERVVLADDLTWKEAAEMFLVHGITAEAPEGSGAA